MQLVMRVYFPQKKRILPDADALTMTGFVPGVAFPLKAQNKKAVEVDGFSDG